MPGVDRSRERKSIERQKQVDKETERSQEGDQELLAQLERERAELDREVETTATSIKSIEASLEDATGEPSSEEEEIKGAIVDSVKRNVRYLVKIGAVSLCLMALASLGVDQQGWELHRC